MIYENNLLRKIVHGRRGFYGAGQLYTTTSYIMADAKLQGLLAAWTERHAENEKKLFNLVSNIIPPLKREIKVLQAILFLTQDEKKLRKLTRANELLCNARKRFKVLWAACNESCCCLKYLRKQLDIECPAH